VNSRTSHSSSTPVDRGNPSCQDDVKSDDSDGEMNQKIKARKIGSKINQEKNALCKLFVFYSYSY